MKRGLRALRRHFGITAANVAVRPEIAWYWRAVWLVVVFVAGFALAYWQFVGRFALPADVLASERQEDARSLQARIVQLESQLRVANAAQGNLAKEMDAMQDEGMRLKEDLAFYKSILAEGGGGVLKIHNVKLTKGARAGEVQYQILLVQSGRHDKVVQGALQLVLSGTQGGKPVSHNLTASGGQSGLKVNFKYYQRLEGVFSLPPQINAQNLQVQFVAVGGKTPALSQSVSLPN